MGNYYDVIESLKFAWQKFRDPELLKWCLFETILIGIPTLLLTLLVGTDKPANLGAVAGILATIVAVYAVMLVAVIIDFFLFRPRILRTAMRIHGIKVPQSLPSSLDWLVLHIRLALVNFFCWYDKKLLIPAVVLLALALVAAGISLGNRVAIVAVILMGVLTAVAWLCAVFIHQIRTMFAPYLFLRADGKEGEMVSKSARLVRGQTLEVFLAMFVYGIAAAVAYLPFLLVGIVVSFVPLAGPVLRVLIALVFSFFLAAIANIFLAGLFKFYDNAGPAGAAAKAKKK